LRGAIAFLLLFSLGCQARAADPQMTVYLTRTGEKYHLDDCPSLRSSKIPSTLQEASDRGYEPCGICRPPRLPDAPTRLSDAGEPADPSLQTERAAGAEPEAEAPEDGLY